MNTVPTGFASLPPEGPATPVIDAAQSERSAARTPRASSAATGSLTAPCAASVADETPHRSRLASFA